MNRHYKNATSRGSTVQNVIFDNKLVGIDLQGDRTFDCIIAIIITIIFGLLLLLLLSLLLV